MPQVEGPTLSTVAPWLFGLILDVMSQAVNDLESPEHGPDAAAWFNSDNDDGGASFSFLTVCHALKLSPEAVRESLRAKGSL